MSSADRPLTRDRERTRLALLEAAERVMSERGSNTSLADIAESARVTKGALMHHFPSRNDLIAALIEHVVERMWDEVMANVDITENRPGKFTRGFVRALTGDSAYIAELSSATGLFAQFGAQEFSENAVDFGAIDAERWNRAFEADGLPLGRVWMIRYATEGLVVSQHSPYLTAEQLRLTREELLLLAEAPDPSSR